MNQNFLDPLSVSSLLNQTSDVLSHYSTPTPRLDAEVLLAHVLKMDRKNLYLSYPNLVTEKDNETLQHLVSRRTKGEPVSYLIGRKEFWSLTCKVNSSVMIPRPETETLVEEALKIFPTGSSPAILDMGTGSGALAIALAIERPRASIIAIDISPKALLVAKENALSHGVTSIRFLEGNLFALLHGEAFDLIMSNPPYIPTPDLPLLPSGIRDFEPRIAFDGGEDGLEFYRKITKEAHDYLKPGGFLLLEVGKDQDQEVSKLITETKKFFAPEIINDLSGIGRAIKAERI